MDGKGDGAQLESRMPRIFRCGGSLQELPVELNRTSEIPDEQKNLRQAGHHLSLQEQASAAFVWVKIE